MLRHKDKHTTRQSFRFPEPTNERKKMLQKVHELFNMVYESDAIYRSTGVLFYDLSSYLPRQTNLFEREFQQKDQNYELSRIINILNYKYG